MLLLNENKNEEMIQILQNLHKYVAAIDREQEIIIPNVYYVKQYNAT